MSLAAGDLIGQGPHATWKLRLDDDGTLVAACFVAGFLTQVDGNGRPAVYDPAARNATHTRPLTSPEAADVLATMPDDDTPIVAACAACVDAIRNGPHLEVVTDDTPPPALPPSSIVAEIVQTHPDLDEEAVYTLAREVAEGLHVEAKRRLVRRITDDREAAAGMRLERARVVTADIFVAERVTGPTPCLGGLVAEGHNAVLAGQYKAGKSTVRDNACAALATGEPFLGIFDVRRPYRVAVLDYEMAEDDSRQRLRQLGLDNEALSRILVICLRGVGLSLTAPAGRRWIVEQLRNHGTEVAVLDTYGAASAPSVESENDNAGGRRFLATWDAIKDEAQVPTSLLTHHFGRGQQEEGAEHGRGATVLDDWADVRIVLTKDRDSGQRFLASEGRSSYNLPESRLFFDETTLRLSLPESSLGENRRRARELRIAEQVAEVVRNEPGILTTQLRDALKAAGLGKHETQSAAVEAAKRAGMIHTHQGAANRVCHYPGAVHHDSQPCPGVRG